MKPEGRRMKEENRRLWEYLTGQPMPPKVKYEDLFKQSSPKKSRHGRELSRA